MRTQHLSRTLPLALLLPLLLLLLLTAAACSEPGPQEAAPAAAPAERVENPELGIALATVPEGFRLVSNDADGILLERKPELAPGEARVTVGPEQQAGVNLVAAVQDQKTAVEARPEGKFLGQLELMGPTGTAFSTRGRYSEDGQEVEEVRLLSLHPMANRLLSVSYVYPLPSDSQDRLDHAMTVLGEIEAFSPPVPAGEGELPAADTESPMAPEDADGGA